jgi:DNA polymerase III subunit gamma/tau
MSYQVIARKYRPQRFDDVVGQEHVTQTLANAIKGNRIAHAYLFCGPRGTGKTTIARIFAKCLNCTDGPKVDFAEDDPRCAEIAEGRSLDVLEIDGASNNGVEQVRELRETCRFAPASSKFKIYIIDEVHMLSTAAFNALLKTLEEPPAHVKFMFATTDPEKVLPTILSRCQRFDLRRIPARQIAGALCDIAKKEKVKIDEPALHAIARGADGGMRDAESTLDQLISFCGEKIVEEDVLSMFGLTARQAILDIAGAVLNGTVEPALRELDQLARNGKDLSRLLGDLLNHFRNLLVYKVSKGDLSLLEVSEAEAQSLAEQGKLADAGALTRILEVLTDAEGRLREVTSKKILLEVVLLKAIQARNAVSIDAVLQRLHTLRSEGGAAVPAASASSTVHDAAEPVAPATGKAAFSALRESLSGDAGGTPAPRAAAPAPSPKPAASVPKSAAPAAPAIEGEALETLWQQIVDAAGMASPFVKTYLLEAHPVAFEKNVLTIGFDPEFADHLALVDNPRNHQLLQTKLAEAGHSRTLVKFIEAPAPPGRARSAAPASGPEAAPSPARKDDEPARKSKPAGSVDMEEFKNDPLIKKALEIFKGQIVDVRA